MSSKFNNPEPDCALCERLCAFRAENRRAHPTFFNAPVPSFGPLAARVLVVGLAPGLKGANQTGRPFTGDAAGDLLYPTLLKFGLAKGAYGRSADDGLQPTGSRITNAVRCVPPQNKVTTAEVKACGVFLRSELAAMGKLETIITLGTVAHGAVLKVLGLKLKDFPFAHGAEHALDGGSVRLLPSYHCSRYNTNTGRLTTEMFEAVFENATKDAKGQP